MKRFLPILVFWIFLFAPFPSQQVSAQHGDTPPLPADAWKGQVIGKVINQTSGKTVTEPVDVMLHAWDRENQERLMVHGKAGPDGTFRFENVDFHQSFFYSVMATYLDATYFSQPANVEKDETSLTLNAQVYDITDDLSNIQIDQLHVLFYLDAGQLGVTQIYALSNAGKRTVKDAVTLPRDRTGTLKFHLPDEAQNVEFGNDASGGRYIWIPGGFADTAPIPPGEGTSQVIVAYYLPFTGKLAYNYLAPVAVKGVSFLVLAGSGLSLQGNSVSPAGERTLQDGSKYTVYTASNLEPGETIQLTLSGNLGVGNAVKTITAQISGNIGLGIGAGILGLSLLGTGVWWWRRSKEEENINMSLGELFVELEELDEAYAWGKVSEDEYRETGAELLARVKLAIRERDDDGDELA